MPESEALKSFLMKVKGESEKAGLKLNIQKIKIMASSPITLLQINRETMETVKDYFGCCKITARRRQWHPIPVLLPGKSHEWRSLIDCGPWGH